jgi:tetratricopeptide (TPR) repeat protein
MNSDRQQAYLNLINQLLNCPSGEEAEVLKTHPELLDDGLVVAMLEEADNLREKGKLNNANWLKNFAGLLGKVDDDFLAGIALKAEADRLLDQGYQQYAISQFREALQSWEQALTIYRQIGNSQGEANSLGNLGLAYRSLGQYDKAIEFLEQSLVISREIGSRQGEANSLGNLGNAYDSLGQFHKAIEFHEQSRKVSEEIGYRKGEANSLGNLGTSYQSLGEYDKAIKSHQQSLDISREIGDRQGEAISLGNLGKTYQSLGEYDKAIKSHQQSLDISWEIGDRQGEAISLGNLGNAYDSLGQYDKAIDFYEPSIQVLELTREHQNRVRGLRQAALIVGDPTIHPNFQLDPHKLKQIPRAKEAAEAIAATLQTQAISGDNATKVAILDRMLNTRIVHLSAHGLIDDFQSSGIPGAIILAPSGDDDGAIHAIDILQLKLDSELVVLSACSTGRGRITGDGVIGLSRCFILAGVPSIVVSLWNMGVISAKLLMTEFYQNLARGDDRAMALRCAMLTTKARFPSPIAWAAFTLIGETETFPLSTEKIDLRSLKMSLPDDAKPEEIVAAYSKLLKISEPQFVAELLAIDVGAMDNVNAIAEIIKDWCESRPQIEENLENEIYQAGAGGTDSDAPEEVVREFYETLKENRIRLGLSGDSVVVETDNSGTESTAE